MVQKAVSLICSMGAIEYGEAWRLQRWLHDLRVRGEIPDVLLLLEHPPTLTLGKSGRPDNVLVSSQLLSDMGISLFLIERGGDVTYHGPGQLVGYPIVDLRRRGKDILRYVNDLEEVMIRTAGDFSVQAGRDAGHRGVWVGQEELGAVGISVRRWVTMHGFALNIVPDLRHFSLINPCGFADRRATSMARLLNSAVDLVSVRERVVYHFASIFETEFLPVTAGELAGLRQDPLPSGTGFGNAASCLEGRG